MKVACTVWIGGKNRDYFKVLPIDITVIVGMPGSGKTFAMLNIAANCLGTGQRVMVLDPKDDFIKLYNVNKNVRIIDVKNITPGALNPFKFLASIDKDGNEIKFSAASLLTLTEILIGQMDQATKSAITPYVRDYILEGEKNPDKTVGQELVNRYRREAKRVLDIYVAGSSEYNMNLEVLNILITLNRLIDYKLPLGQLESLFAVKVDSGEGFDKLNYFQICTLLYIIENKSEYQAFKDLIEIEVKRRITSLDDLVKSENVHLFFDVMTCPYLKNKVGMEIIKSLTKGSEAKAYQKRAELAKPGRWFFDWDKSHTVASFLVKKEYHSPYE